MTQTVAAIFEGGVLRPLHPLNLDEHEQVEVTVRQVPHATNVAPTDDPLRGLSISTGIPDLAEHFDDYRFGRRRP